MDESLGYAAWLVQQDTQKSTLELSFADNSWVLFSLIDHVTSIDTVAKLDIQEPNLD